MAKDYRGYFNQALRYFDESGERSSDAGRDIYTSSNVGQKPQLSKSLRGLGYQEQPYKMGELSLKESLLLSAIHGCRQPINSF